MMDLAQLRDYWQRAWRHPYAGAVAIVAVALTASLLAWQLGRLLWLFSSGPVERLLPPPFAPAVTLPARIEPQRIAGLFGESAAAPAVAGSQSTTLQLRLDGVMTNPSRELARAFIADRGVNKVQTYRPGDALPGGAELLRVEPLQVIIGRNGQEEILRFDKPGTPVPPATPPASASAQQTQNALGAAASRLANSPMAALRQMGLRRTSQGYIVSVTAPKDMLQRFGLQPGDRIVSVNAQPVGRDLDADQKTMSQLQQAGSARVEVQRGEQTITLEQKL
ncbi:MAG: type II secretion system protein N [Pseudomonadota bacterium]